MAPLHTLLVVSEWCQKAYGLLPEAFSFPEHSAYLWAKQRAGEGTRTPALLQLRVIGRALQGFAGTCKSRISREVSFPCLALGCTVLRSRWYQNGISPLLIGSPVVPHLSNT